MTDKPTDAKTERPEDLIGPVRVRDPEVEAFLIGGAAPSTPAYPVEEPPVGGAAAPDEGAEPFAPVPDPTPQTGIRARLGGLFRRGRPDSPPKTDDHPEETGPSPETEEAPAPAEVGPVANTDEDALTSGTRRPGLFGRLIRKDRTPRAAPSDEGGETVISPDMSPVSPEGSEGDQGAAAAEPRPEGPAPSGGLLARLRKPTRPAPVPAPPLAEGDAPVKAEAPHASAPRRSRRARPKRGFPPIQVLIGWIGESSRKDVLAHARGFAADHIEAIDSAWIAMAEFRGGTLFEIHEGGSGNAYLPELIEVISRDPDQVLWVPSGTKMNRVVTFSIVEGRPFSMMLNEAESARVRASGQVPVERVGRMRRLSPRGNPVLVIGATLFSVSFSALAASAFLSARVDQQPVPSLSYNAEILPHGQIVSLSDALREDRWVSRILFEDGAWRAEFETFDELVLPEDTGAAQEMIDEAVKRDEVLQQERDRKIEELRAQ